MISEPEHEESFRVTLARLEAKLDVALAQHTGRLDRQDEKIARQDEKIADHETRLRTQEAERPLTGRTLVSYMVAALTIALAIIAVLEHLIS